MKVFEILNGFCHHYYPEYKTAAEARQFFHPSIQFVDAPDYVFESWGYDNTAEGDACFLHPEPPEGWGYDPETGTFYPLEETAEAMGLSEEITPLEYAGKIIRNEITIEEVPEQQRQTVCSLLQTLGF